MNDDTRYLLSMALIDRAYSEGLIKECGSCFYWMKSRFCPREINVNGRNRGPSFKDIACKKFKDKKEAE